MSPLFPTIHGAKTCEVRVSYVPSEPITPVAAPAVVITVAEGEDQPWLSARPGGKLSITMPLITTNDCQPVSSVEEAENILLNMGEVFEHEILLADKTVPECYAGILIQALHYGNQITSCTRRGTGNVILMGRDAWKMVDEAYQDIGSNALQPVPSETVGRWEKKGLLIGGVAVYVGDGISANEVFVAYVGLGTAIDGPGGLLKDDEDLYLRVLDNTTSTLGNASDYVRRFRIVIK